jgi:hypothetical protein
MGGAYVYRCLTALLDPKVPVRVRYASAGGVGEIYAGAFKIDPFKLTVTAEKIRLSTPGEPTSASIERLVLQQIGPVQTVRASGVAAQVVRTKNGDIDLKKFGLKPTGKPDTSIVRIDVEDARLFVLDNVSKDPRWTTVTLASTHAEGALGNWTGRSTLSGLGISNLPVSFVAPTAGPTTIATLTNDTDLAPAVRFLAAAGYVNVQGADVSKLLVTGPASVSMDGPKVVPNGDLFIKVFGLNYPGYARDLALSGRVTGQGEAWTGDVHASGSGMTIAFKGKGTMGSNLSLDGEVLATADTTSSLPAVATRSLPKNIAFRSAKVQGRVAWFKNQPTGNLAITAQQISYDQNVATSVHGRAVCEGVSCTAVLDNASVGKGGVEGRVTYRLSDQALAGFFRSKGDASVLLSAYLPKEMSLQARALAVVGGTLKRPTIEGFADGKGLYRVDEDHVVRVEKLVVRAESSGDAIKLIAEGNGPLGHVRTAGYIRQNATQLDLTVEADGLNAAAFDPTYQGSGRVWGTVKGPVRTPLVEAHVQAVNLRAKEFDVPALAGSVVFQDNKLSIVDAVAMAKGGVASARGGIDLGAKTLALQFQGQSFSLSELGLADTFGRVDVSDGKVSGTIEHPEIVAQVHSDNAYFARYKIDTSTATVRYSNGKASTDDLVVKADKGLLTGAGEYDLDTQTWNARVSATQLPLERLRLDIAEANPSGVVGLSGNLSGNGTKVLGGDANVKLDDVAAFGQSVGSGTVKANLAQGVVSASGQIGDLDKVIDITSATYALDSGKTRFSLDASEVKLGRILQAFTQRNRDWNPDLRALLAKVDSTVSAHIEGESDSENRFHFLVPVLEAREITIDGRPAGTVQASAENLGDTVKLNSLTWKHLDAIATAAGTYTLKGPVAGELSVTNLTAETLTSLFPNLPVRGGRLAELTVSVDGTSDNPAGRASATFSQIVLADSKGNPLPTPLDISIFDASLANRTLTLDGSFNVTAPSKETRLDFPIAGLSGILKATVPLDALNGDSDQEYTATVQLSKPRPANILAQFVPGLDAKRTTGELTGSVTVRGRKDATRFAGEVVLAADQTGQPARLEFTDRAFTLTDVRAQINVSETQAVLSATGKTTDGQPATLDLTASYPNVVSNGFSIDDLRTSTLLNGSASVDTDVRATLPGASKASYAHVAARLKVDGFLQRPEIGGSVSVSKGSFSLPLFFAPTGSGTAPTIDPAFNVDLNLASGTRIDAPLANLSLSEARGTLSGRLSDPVLRMPLGVEAGIVRLPTSRIRIDPGSQVAVALEQGGTPRLDLNVTGHANYTKLITQNFYQTYDLTLQIQGNLISEDPLRITGQSDPVGLTQDEIQAFVTQRSLLETLVNTATGTSTAGATQSTLYSIAVPSLSGFLTDPVAEALGLDFLTLDYNPFDQTVVSAGKTLFRHLTLQVTRQLVAPINGQPREELRLSYAFPTRDRFLSQLRLNLTKATLTPWRIGLSFGGRF